MSGNKFSYKYRALGEKERKLVESIRSQYLEEGNEPRKGSAPERKARVLAVLMGIAVTLVFGTGMSMTLVWEIYLGGILVSLWGAAAIIGAYPLYKYLLKDASRRN